MVADYFKVTCRGQQPRGCKPKENTNSGGPCRDSSEREPVTYSPDNGRTPNNADGVALVYHGHHKFSLEGIAVTIKFFFLEHELRSVAESTSVSH